MQDLLARLFRRTSRAFFGVETCENVFDPITDDFVQECREVEGVSGYVREYLYLQWITAFIMAFLYQTPFSFAKYVAAKRERRKSSLPVELPPPETRSSPKSDSRFVKIHKRVLLVAVIAVMALTLMPWVVQFALVENRQSFGPTRGRSMDLEKIASLNEKLVKALLMRGRFLIDAGNQMDDRAYLEEGLADLREAYSLEPNNLEVLSMLTRVSEKLGKHRQAKMFFEEWRIKREEWSETQQ